MKITIRTRGIDIGDGEKEYVRRRLRFALGRFSPRIERVMVRLSDVNGPRGGVDIRCSVEIMAVGVGVLRVEDTALTPRHAVASASERLSRAVARAFHRVKRIARTEPLARSLPLPGV